MASRRLAAALVLCLGAWGEPAARWGAGSRAEGGHRRGLQQKGGPAVLASPSGRRCVPPYLLDCDRCRGKGVEHWSVAASVAGGCTHPCRVVSCVQFSVPRHS